MSTGKDEFDLDNFDLDDFDLDGNGGYTGKKPGRARKITAETAGGFFTGLRQGMFSKSAIRNTIEKALPKTYVREFDAVAETLTGVKDLYDTSTSEVGKAIKDIKKAIKQALPTVEDSLPPSVTDRLKKLTDDVMLSGPKIDQDAATLAQGMSETFGPGAAPNSSAVSAKMGLGDGDPTSTATQFITDFAKNKLTMESNAHILAVRQNIQRMVAYQDTITNAYQRKMIELKYKTLFVARKHLDEFQRYAGFMNANIAHIRHNTSLPDIVKTQASEMALQMLKQNFMGKIGTSAAGTFGKRLIAHNKAKIQSFFKEAGGAIPDAILAGADMADAAKFGSAFGGSKHRTAAEFIGQGIGQFLAPFIGGKLKDKIAKHTGVKVTAGKLDFLREHFGQVGDSAGDWAGNTGNTILDHLTRLLGVDEVAKRKQSKMVMRSLTHQDLTGPAQYDVQTKRTITEIIPGLLSKIHAEVHMHRTGKTTYSPQEFSWKSNKFESVQKAGEQAVGGIVNKHDAAYVAKDVRDHATKVLAGLPVSEAAKAWYTKYIFVHSNKDRYPGANPTIDVLFDPGIKKYPALRKALMSQYGLTDADLSFDHKDATSRNKLSQTIGLGDTAASDTYRKHVVGAGKLSTTNYYNNAHQNAINASSTGQAMHLVRGGVQRIRRDAAGNIIHEFNDDWATDLALRGGGDGGNTLFSGLNPLNPDAPQYAGKPHDYVAMLNAMRRKDPERYAKAIAEIEASNHAAQLHGGRVVDLRTGRVSEVTGTAPRGRKSPAPQQRRRQGSTAGPTPKPTTGAPAQSVRGAANGLRQKLGGTWGKAVGLGTITALLPMSAMASTGAVDPHTGLVSLVAAGAAAALAAVMPKGWMPSPHSLAASMRPRNKGSRGAAGNAASTAASAHSNVDHHFKSINDTLGEMLIAIKMLAHLPAQGAIPQQRIRWYQKNIGDVIGGTLNAGKALGGHIGSKLWQGVRNVPRGFGLAWRGAKAGVGALGMAHSGLQAVGAGLRQINPFIAADLYVKGETMPALTGKGMRAGIYVDVATGHVIKRLKDITGPVARSDDLGSLLLTQQDIDHGLELKKPKGRGFVRFALGTVAGALGRGVSNMVSVPQRVFGAVSWLKRRVLSPVLSGAANRYAFPGDVYVRGETDPRMMITVQRGGGYICNGKPVRRVSDIVGEVTTLAGEVVLTHSDIVKGLVDHRGRPLRGLVTRTLLKAFAAPVGLYKKAKATLQWAGRTALGAARGLRNVVAGNWPAMGYAASQKNGETLERIYKLLDQRLPGGKHLLDFELDADGNRAGSAKSQALAKTRKGLKSAVVNTKEKLHKHASGALDFLKGLLPKSLGSGLLKLGAAGLVAVLGKSIGESIAGPIGGQVGAALGAITGFAPIKSAKAAWWAGKKVLQGGKWIKDALMAGKAASRVASAARAARVGLMGAEALGGLGGMAAVGEGLAAAGTLVAGIFSAPVLLAVGATALLGYGAYKLYKHYTKTVCPALRFRMAQYGFDLDDEDKAGKVMAFEAKMLRLVKCAKDKSATLDGDPDAEADIAAFGIDMKDEKAVVRWGKWFSGRFKPVFLSAVSTMFNMTGSKDLQNADKVLKGDQLVNYIKFTHYNQSDKSPYNVMPSPFKESWYVRNTVKYDRGDVNDIYETQLKLAYTHRNDAPASSAAVTSKIPAIAMAKAGLLAGGAGAKAGAAIAKSLGLAADPKTGTLQSPSRIVALLKRAAMGVPPVWLAVKASKWVGKQLTTRGDKVDRFCEVMRMAAAAGDPHPAIFAAQWVLVSNWGMNGTGKNNLFGIAATPGDGYEASSVTVYDKTGSREVIMRDYPSEQAAANDRVRAMQQSKALVEAKYFTAKTPIEAAAAFQASGFVHDSTYGDKLLAVIKGIGLDPTQPSSNWSQQIAAGGSLHGSMADKIVGSLTGDWKAVKAAAAAAAAGVTNTASRLYQGAVNTVSDGISKVVDTARSVKNAVSKVAGNIGAAVGGMINGTLTLTNRDVMDLAKLASTEVVSSLASPHFEQQCAGVLDTVMNRVASGHWGKSVKEVINARRQFSKITGPASLSPYGSIDNMPDTAVNKKVLAYTQAYLRKRASGTPSIVGGNLCYANKWYSDSANRRAWVDEFCDEADHSGLCFGQGKSVHWHGTTKDLLRFMPGAFKVVLSGDDKVALEGAFKQSTAGALVTGTRAAVVSAKTAAVDTASSIGSRVGAAASRAAGAVSGAVATVGKVGANVATAAVGAVGNAVQSARNGLNNMTLDIPKGRIDPQLITIGQSAVKLAGKDVVMQGMNKAFMEIFYSMVGEYFKMTHKQVQINSAFRPYSVQAAFYARYLSQGKPLAAKPGNSMHEFGLAIDINSADANAMDKLGLLQKYGFCRPLANAAFKELWHLELAALVPHHAALKSNDPATVAKVEAAIRGNASLGKGAPSTVTAQQTQTAKPPAGAKTAPVLSASSAKTIADTSVGHDTGKPMDKVAKSNAVANAPAVVQAAVTSPAASSPAAATPASSTPSSPADQAISAQAQLRKQSANQAAVQHQAIVSTSQAADSSAQTLADSLTVHRSVDDKMSQVVALLTTLTTQQSAAQSAPAPVGGAAAAPPPSGQPKPPTSKRLNAPVSLSVA